MTPCNFLIQIYYKYIVYLCVHEHLSVCVNFIYTYFIRRKSITHTLCVCVACSYIVMYVCVSVRIINIINNIISVLSFFQAGTVYTIHTRPNRMAQSGRNIMKLLRFQSIFSLVEVSSWATTGTQLRSPNKLVHRKSILLFYEETPYALKREFTAGCATTPFDSKHPWYI